MAHLYFLQSHRPTQKNPKEPPSQRTKTADNERTTTTEKNNEGITAPTQKAGFRVPKTVLWIMKV